MTQKTRSKAGFWIGAFLVVGLVAGGVLVAAVAAPTLMKPDASAAAPDSVSAGILPHRAYYRMETASVRNGSPVRGAEGSMFFTWRDACDGWTVEQHLNLTLLHDEADEARLSTVYTTWESKDGKRYRFNYRHANNGQVDIDQRGTATLSGPGGSGTAHYTVPEAKDVALPEGSYFPTSHTLALVRAAQAHKPMLTATVFDGTDEEGLSEISAVIGASKPLVSEVAKTGLNAGASAEAWPIRMAFFPMKDDQSVPDYEMDTDMLANGVSEFMLIDYGEFKLRGTLEKIELLPKPDC